jgi:hypothetical protein
LLGEVVKITGREARVTPPAGRRKGRGGQALFRAVQNHCGDADADPTNVLHQPLEGFVEAQIVVDRRPGERVDRPLKSWVRASVGDGRFGQQILGRVERT